jgi:Xaa-Pro aminopeptidase
MDYGHGTGHGVGHVLSVHEGPASLSKRGSQEILAGMILSNEPGYYHPGEFGIRQENLVHVINVCDDFLGFENLTFVPFDKRLIDTSLLSKTQLDALNSYHKEVLEKISPHLPHVLQDWLEHKCEALS